ncbi:hypothetical protein BBJ28_00019790 [Nothophytophthora sp. Chile5]|nr:hypothetical protein BBJ28_00019790 [Nothophytophthora sp. Chile5]
MTTGTNASRPLQRHPKCSALYASSHCLQVESELQGPSLDPSVAYLTHMTVEVTNKAQAPGTTFALTVHDHKSSSTWRHARSYAECRAFQTRVLRALRRGHLCFAECPWLYAFVQRALPAERPGHRLFRVAGHGARPRVVETRRQAVVKLLATLKRVLLNPLNQRCSVLREHVAPEVVAFITNRGAAETLAPWQQRSPTCLRPLARTFSESFLLDEPEKQETKDLDRQPYSQSSSTTTSSMDDGDDLDDDCEQEHEAAGGEVVGGQRVCCAMCALHASRSDEQVFAGWHAKSSSNRFMRFRAGAGAERASIVANRQSPSEAETVAKGAWSSPRFSERVTSPLEHMAVLGGRESDMTAIVAFEHDGTPIDPFPGTPRHSSASSLWSSSVCEIDLELVDAWRPSNDFPSPPMAPSFVQTAPAAVNWQSRAPEMEKEPSPNCSGIAKLRCMPRRSLRALGALREKLTTPKRRSGTVI